LPVTKKDPKTGITGFAHLQKISKNGQKAFWSLHCFGIKELFISNLIKCHHESPKKRQKFDLKKY